MKRSNNAATEAQATVAIYSFDTMKAVNRLEEAGLPREQAQAYVDIVKTAVTEAVITVSGAMATKSDLSALESKMNAGFEVMEGKMNAGFEVMATKSDLSAMESKMTRWFVTTLLAVGGLVIAAMGGLLAVAVRVLITALG